MKITAQEEYGLRCLLQLARVPQGKIMAVGDIAKKEGISSAYAEKLLRILARAGLVHSVRGIKGGYVLNRPASQVTLGEIVRALGSVITTTEICGEYTGHHATCVHFSDCSIRSIWAGLTTYIQRFLDETTLAMLLEKEYELSNRLARPRSFAA